MDEMLAHGHNGSALCIPVWKVLARRPMACISQDLCSKKWLAEPKPLAAHEKPACALRASARQPRRTAIGEGWNPVLESHQPLRLCRPPPELLGQRDRN